MARFSLMNGQAQEGLRVLGFLAGLYEFGRDDAFDAVTTLRDAYLLALLAYAALLRSPRSESGWLPSWVMPGDDGTWVDFLLECLAGPRAWAARRAADYSEGPTGSWKWWETEFFLPTRVRALRFDDLLDDALLDALISGAHTPNELHDETDYFLARRLIGRLEALAKGSPAEETPSQRMESLLQDLRRGVEVWQAREAESLARRPLESDRIRAFRSAIAGELATRPRLLERFASGIEIEVVGQTTVLSTANGRRAVLGTNLLVPREYFVHTNVLADPAQLGRTIAQSLLRAEEQWLLERLEASATSRESALTDVSAMLADWLSQAASPLLLVENSWALYTGITADADITVPDPRMLEPREVTQGHECFFVSSDHNRFAIWLIDGGEPGFPLRWASRGLDPTEGLRPLATTGLSAGVFDVPIEESDQPSARVELGETLAWNGPDAGGSIWLCRVPDVEW